MLFRIAKIAILCTTHHKKEHPIQPADRISCMQPLTWTSLEELTHDNQSVADGFVNKISDLFIRAEALRQKITPECSVDEFAGLEQESATFTKSLESLAYDIASSASLFQLQKNALLEEQKRLLRHAEELQEAISHLRSLPNRKPLEQLVFDVQHTFTSKMKAVQEASVHLNKAFQSTSEALKRKITAIALSCNHPKLKIVEASGLHSTIEDSKGLLIQLHEEIDQSQYSTVAQKELLSKKVVLLSKVLDDTYQSLQKKFPAECLLPLASPFLMSYMQDEVASQFPDAFDSTIALSILLDKYLAASDRIDALIAHTDELNSRATTTFPDAL